MNKDFSQYKNIIDQFRGKVLKPDFESRFAVATEKLIKTERFLLKMELKRLAGDCTRLIDLRGHVDGECRAYEHEDRIHFLDDIAIKVFDENYKAYQGYTFGVYEAVKNTENNFRVIYEKEKQAIKDPSYHKEETKPPVLEKTQYPATFCQLGHYPNRIEERMNFAIPVRVTFKGNISVVATSSDLSVRGCKLRFNEKQKIELGDEVSIRFTGLEEEFQFGQQRDFSYQVKNIHTIDNIQLVGFSRVPPTPQVKEGFTEFLKGFIQGNKRRYKINLDNTINALKARSVEHFILPKINELPIYLVEEKEGLLPRYVLTSPNNRKVFTYWQDEFNKSTVNFLIPPERFARLKKAQTEKKPLIVYSFIHISQGKHFFYTADEQQLSYDHDFLPQFLGFAANKSSFKITELSLIPVKEELADFPFTVANTLLIKDQYLNQPPSDDVNEVLDGLPYIVVANDITCEHVVKNYQYFDYSSIEVSKLKNFGHKRNKQPLLIDEMGINYKNQRQEMRFKYKTPAVVELPRTKLQGVSHDFSMSGLKIELEKPIPLDKGSVVHLSFPNLQKITSAFDLTGLPYEIVHMNEKKTIINCRIYVEKHQHIGRNFFKLLIEKNRDKLEPDVHDLMTPGLGKALRNIYSGSIQIPSLVVQTSGSRYKIESIIGSEPNTTLLSRMKTLSDREGFYNLYPLLNNPKAMNRLHDAMKKAQTSASVMTQHLYISINPNVESIEKAVNTRLGTELENDKQREFFIKNALKKGEFYCIQVKLFRTSEPDMVYLNPELSYIGSYAIHRGKQIEQDIWSVVGMIQVFDITHETLFRHNLLSKMQVDYS